MSRSLCGATLVRSKLRVTAKGCAARSSVRSGCNLTIGARSPGGDASAAAEPAASWAASGWAVGEGVVGEGVVGALAVTDGWWGRPGWSRLVRRPTQARILDAVPRRVVLPALRAAREGQWGQQPP